MTYYVYAYLDPLKPGTFIYEDQVFTAEPFYIGKGKGKRCEIHLRLYKGESNRHKSNRIKKIIRNGKRPEIVLLKTELQEQDALNLERELIQKIGRTMTKTGPLVNITTGGEGWSGLKHTEETKKKLREITNKRLIENPNIKKQLIFNLNKFRTENPTYQDGKNAYWYGKNMSEPTKNKMSRSMKSYIEIHPGCRSGKNSSMFGRHHSEETKLKMKKKSEGRYAGYKWIHREGVMKHVPADIAKSLIIEGWLPGMGSYKIKKK